jgi:aminopeptidase N
MASVCGRSGDHLERTALVEVELTGERTPLDLPAGADLYLVNDEDLTFASTRPDATTRDAFFGNAARLPTATARGVAVTTAWDMLVNGEATAAEAVQCLTGVLAVETSASVIEPYLNLAVEAAELWSPESERDGLLRAVAAACRGLSRTATGLEEVAWLQAEAGEDVDLQWRVLVRKAQLGLPTAAEAQALLDRDPDPEAWVSRLQVRAATPDAAEKKAVWQTVVTDRAVPLASLHSVAALFWSAGQDDVLRPYAQAYLDLVPTLHRGGAMPASTFTRSLFPRFGVDLAFVRQAEDLAAQAVPVVRTNLMDLTDRMRRILCSRG